MSEQSSQPIADDGISIKDIVDFLVKSWKTIFGFGVVGLLSAIAFIFITPSKYEAFAQIRVAQIDLDKNINSLGIDLEDANTLIARMRLPTAFSEKTIQACKHHPETLVNGVVKLTAIKEVTSLVELKISAESKEDALVCAQAIFENIKDSQHVMTRPYVELAKTLLLKYQIRLNDAQTMIARADKSSQALSAAYLATRDEIKFLSDEVIRLNRIIISSDSRPAKLVSPIYASNRPVLPNKRMALSLGLLIGLSLGLLYASVRSQWRAEFRLTKGN
jgi:capsular polysaccharide biosynthesis protein